jgi:Mlc titration factor MtfA (ptsG expression regulator)
LADMPFPAEWENILQRNVSLYRHLPDSLREQLHNDIKIFIAEKHFEGLGGLEMTDEIKITIAAEACLLLLNRKNKDYPGLSSILVYPSAYVATQNIPIGGGVYIEGQSAWENPGSMGRWSLPGIM